MPPTYHLPTYLNMYITTYLPTYLTLVTVVTVVTVVTKNIFHIKKVNKINMSQKTCCFPKNYFFTKSMLNKLCNDFSFYINTIVEIYTHKKYFKLLPNYNWYKTSLE